jgi:amino acid adenylation domain-containing protein
VTVVLSQIEIDTESEAHRLATRIALLDREKRTVLLRRLIQQGVETSTLPIVPFSDPARRPVSYAQRGLWLTWRMAPNSPAYNMAGTLVLEGSLDARALETAMDDLARRHEVLRTVFRPAADGEPEQEILAPSSGALRFDDLTTLPAGEREAPARLRLQQHASEPFDLENGPVWRALLLRLNERSHWLGIVVHHIAADGWSIAVLIEDLAALYEARLAGVEPALPPLRIRFADYALWQREWIAAGELDRQLNYWQRRLGTEHSALPLPLDRARPAVRHDSGAQYRFWLTAEVAAGVRELAEGCGGSVFMVMLALLKAVVARHCGVDDICIGVPVANRSRAETHRLVGYLTNVLVVRTRVELHTDFRSLLTAVREAMLEAQSNADCPFDLLVSSLVKERHSGINPLFQVKCTEQDRVDLRDFGGLRVTTTPVEAVHAHFDLSLDFTAGKDGIRCDFTYPTDIFDEATVARLAGVFMALAQRVVTAPDASMIALLPTEDLSVAVGERLSLNENDDVVARWERSVLTAPHALALRQEERSITRGEVDAWANTLAARLGAFGVGPEVCVGVHGTRSIELVVGLLAVLKAGGTYVPLDPAIPAERLAYQARDSRIALLLSAEALAWEPGVPVWPLVPNEGVTFPVARPVRTPHTTQGAYIIYTSGSTGRPKGVVVSRGALANYVSGVLTRLNLPESVISMAMVSTVAADLGHTVLFGALSDGKLLHLISAERAFDADRFAEYMQRHSVDVLKIVPAHLQALLNASRPEDSLPRHTLILGGAATHWPLLDRIHQLSPTTRVLNHYGPTETTVGILTQEAGDARREATVLPVGKPLSNSAAYVLDGKLQPVPRGTVGELYLGGDAVARGYQGRAAQSAERFVASPFELGGRLYRSGDRVRQLPDGSVEFLGRVDDQVKIRGYRVELDEIAQLLLTQPQVEEATAIARDGKLYGYVTIHAGHRIEGSTLCERLRETLPDYMVPSGIVILDELPKNANGKIDRRALPVPEAANDQTYEAPRSEVERVLAALWADVLGVERVGREDNFFALGGDSILSLKLAAQARKRGIALAPRAVFKHQQLHELAASLATQALEPTVAIPTLDHSKRTVPQPLSYAQARQWFLWQLNRQSTAYHISSALKLDGALNADALRTSFDALVSRHESLRTVFRPRADGQTEQIVLNTVGAHLENVDLTEYDAGQRDERVRTEVMRFHQTPFDLERGPLLRVGLIRVSFAEHVLVVVMHHIVSDGWSMQILIDEFVKHFQASTRGESATLPLLPIQYLDYAVWQRNWLEAGERERQLAYWKGQLGDDQPLLQLPVDRSRPMEPVYHAALHDFELAPSLAHGVRQRANERRTTVFTVLLAGLQALLHRYTDQRDIRIGMPNANRNRPQTEGIVGFFVNMQVLRGEVDAGMSLTALLEQARVATEAAQDNQDLPFDQLVEVLQPERVASHQPLFSVTMNHQRRDFRNLAKLPAMVVSSYGIGEQHAPFELTLETVESADGTIYASFRYARELFREESIAQLARHYVKMLHAIVDAAHLRVADVRLVDDGDAEQLIQWGVSASASADHAPVHSLIEQRASSHADAVALIASDGQLSYGQLNARANRLAHRLLALGVTAETRVGIALERSFEMIIGLLAVLKAGGAYVPLDADYPKDRLQSMVEDSGIGHLLTQRAIVARLPSIAGVEPLLIDALDLSAELESDPRRAVHGDNLAYVIYTSGSTGRPKGVAVPHGALSMHLRAIQQVYGITAADRQLLFASISFDAAGEQWMLPLLAGAAIVLPTPGDKTFEHVEQLIAAQAVSILYMPPAYLRRFLETLRGRTLPVRLCVAGGEAWARSDFEAARRAFTPERLVNAYGPTETVITPTAWSADSQAAIEQAHLPIGSVVGERAAYVLDSQMNLVPQGVAGELYLGGFGLARGYLLRAGLTAERFVADPFAASGARLYRTGDSVRWNRQGQLEYLGRIDQQLKIRGFRIEVGEIEAQLLAQREVRQAIVLSQGEADQKRLLAYVVPDEDGVRGATSPTDVSSRSELVTHWESVFDATYEIERTAPSFQGWNSSYSDQPIPEIEMREWLQNTVERIRALRPERILEVGCGAGLLVEQLAPAARVYAGTDLSARAVNGLRAWAETQPQLAHVRLRQAEATDFSGIQPGEFDTVVLNSVAQYLPDVDYLLAVLEGAARVLAPRGQLFIGDLRHLAHVPLLHASVQLHKASAQTSVRQLKNRIARAVSQDKELVLDPAFFHALAAHLGMGSVEISLKRGGFDNELTRYRYDVAIRKDSVERPTARVFDACGTDAVERLAAHLKAHRPPAVLLRAVPNRRMSRDLAAWRLLESLEGRSTVGELLSRLERTERVGIDPQTLWALGDEHGYHVRISWSEQHTDGAFDVEFIDPARLALVTRAHQLADPPASWRVFASDPARAVLMQQLGPRLRERLAQVLPEYMVPAHFIVLDQLPLNANGKVDRKQLPEPEQVEAGHYQAPQGPIERTLAKIWAEVLGVERIGRGDNFFELGGHSLMAIRIVSQARRVFDCELSLRALFEHPCLSEQAGLIQSLPTARSGPVFHAATSSRPALSHAQQRLWFLWRLDPGSASMNSASALRLAGPLDLEAWRFACQFVVARHASLRTVFREENGTAWQEVLDETSAPELAVTDLGRWQGDSQLRHLQEHIAQTIRRPFDLERGPLLRVQLYRLAEDEHVMCVVMHHIVTDAWSTTLVVQDFVAAYAARRRGEIPALVPPSLQYVDYAIGQREWLEQGEMRRQLDYWTERLTGVPPLVVPPDQSPPAQRSHPCGVMRTSLDAESTAALRTFCESQGVTPFMVLLTAVSVVVRERSRQERFVVGTDFANRNHPRTESLVGFLVNQVALPIDCHASRSARELLTQVRNTVLGAADHQDLPFERLVESLRSERRGDGRAPLFQLKVLYQDDGAAALALPGLHIDEYPIEPAQVELDLILMFHADAQRVHLAAKYDRELFEPATLECMGLEILSILKVMLPQPEVELAALADEAKRIRRDFEARALQRRDRKLAQWRGSLRGRSVMP